MATSGKYYAYINKGIRGPLPPRDLSKLNGFDHNTLVCQEENFGHWLDVSTLDEFSFIFDPDFYDVSAETRKDNDSIEEAEQISQTESEDANAYKAVLERAIAVNGDLEKQVREQEEKLKKSEDLLSEADKKISESEKMLKEASQRSDENAAKLKEKEEELAAAGRVLEEKERELTAKERELRAKESLLAESNRKLEDLRVSCERDRDEFAEILKTREASIKDLEDKLAKAPKPEHPSWEALYKAAKQRSDELTADFTRKLNTKDEQLKFMSDTMEKTEAAMKLVTQKRDKEMKMERERTQFSLDQKDAEISSLKTDLQIKEDEINSLVSRNERFEEDKKKLLARIEEKEKQNQELQAQLAAGETDKAAMLADGRKAVTEANQHLEEKQKEIDAMKSAQAEIQAELEKLRKLAGESLAMKERAEKAEKELESLNDNTEDGVKKFSGSADSQEIEHLKNEIMRKDTELSNLRADLSEATRRIQEATTTEEINARKRDEFYDMVNRKIVLLSDYIKEIEGRMNS